MQATPGLESNRPRCSLSLATGSGSAERDPGARQRSEYAALLPREGASGLKEARSARESAEPVDAARLETDMWPFRRKPDAPPWYQEAHDKLRLAAMELERRLVALENRFDVTAQGIASAKQLEGRVAGLALATRQCEQLLADEAAAWRAQVESVRGLATGARGGRPRNEEREADRQALELGRRLQEQASTPQGRAQLIQELQAMPGQTDALGNPIRPPVRNGGPV